MHNNDGDEEELNSEDFESEEEKYRFKEMFKQYKESKKMMEESMRMMMELQTFLYRELHNKDKQYVMLPEKFVAIKNCPVCMVKFDSVFTGLIAIILN